MLWGMFASTNSVALVGVEARAALEELLDAQVHLETRVKVQKNWRGNEDFIRRVGYSIPKRQRS